MRINYNVSAMISNNALSNSDDLLAKSLERLSSGLKINNAKDNPAGLAMAKRMNAQLEGLSKASQNASDGISIIETADGALSEIQEMVQRMNELSVKASTGTLTDADREIVQDEIKALSEEIERIADATEFNSQKLLNGEFDRKAYSSVEAVKISYCSDAVPVKEYSLTDAAVTYDPEGNINSFTATFGTGFPSDIAVEEIKDNVVTLKADHDFEMKLDLSAVAKAQTADIGVMTIDVTDIGPMRLQIGANEGQVLEVRIPEINLLNMGIKDLDVSTEAGAKDALSRMGGAVEYISSVRSRLGAYQNRLESSVNNLDITNENMTAAYSRIMDVDMAEEMTNYTTYQVLAQAGTSMLAQANERPSQVLQLLQ
ncbi:MAG: flagellin [Lachnospiraceae bacterium]